MTQEKNEESFVFPFEKLDVWHRAVDLADCTLNLMQSLPPNTYSGLTSQMETAVSRVAQHIAEGKGRQYKKEFIQLLHRAEGSLFEVLTVTALLKRRGCIREQEGTEIRRQAEIIDRMLHGLMNSLQK